MHRWECQLAAALLVALFTSLVARGQPTVPPGYTVERYIGTAPSPSDPEGMAFSHNGEFGRPSELYVFFSGQGARRTLRMAGPGNPAPFATTPNSSVAMVFPDPNSAFGPYLYATTQDAGGSGITRYDSNGAEEMFASFSAMAEPALKFSSGGAWGTRLYMAASGGPNGNSIERFDADGTSATLTSGLAANPNAMDFSPGGAWGDFLYVACSGSNITKVDSKGNKTSFLPDVSAMKGWLIGMAFDTGTAFGGDLFVTADGSGSIFRITPDGNVSTFASGIAFGRSPFSGDLVFGPDGSLYVGEGGTGTVWRISGGPMGPRRDAALDLAVLRGGGELKGAVTNESFTLAAPLRLGGWGPSEWKLPAEKVVGMAASPGDANVLRVLLVDGQVVRGTAGPDAVLNVRLPDGNVVAVPLAGLVSWSYRISKERPEETAGPYPAVLLKTGEVLRFDPNLASILLLALDAPIPLGTKELARIDGEHPPSPRLGVRLVFTNGSTLIAEEKGDFVNLPLAPVGGVHVPLGLVAAFQLREVRKADPELAELKLADGGRLLGRLAGDAVELAGPDGNVSVEPADIRCLSQEGPEHALAVVLWGSGPSRNHPTQPTVTFEVLPGPKLVVPVAGIASLTVPKPPEQILGKVEELIRQLGAAKFTDREEATKALIRMGEEIAPMLEKHKADGDPEVRQRIEEILSHFAQTR